MGRRRYNWLHKIEGRLSEMAKQQTGKGGLWDTRPNPFAQQKGRTAQGHLGDVSGLGVALDKVLSTGCAIMFGLTRDGGAMVLTVLDGDERHRTYCSNQSELDLAVEALDLVYTAD